MAEKKAKKKSMSDAQAKTKRKKLKKEGKSGIVIKPQNEGKFTAWCKSHGFPGPNSSCIAAAKKAGGAAAKMAVFAQNAKTKFNH
jgi:hypothetical protein